MNKPDVLKKPFTDKERADFVIKHSGRIYHEDDKKIWFTDDSENEPNLQDLILVQEQILNSTDWMMTREIDNIIRNRPTQVSMRVLDQRAQARIELSRLRAQQS